MTKNQLMSGMIGIQVCVLLIFVIMVSLGGCTDKDKSTSILESQGYTQIQAGGYSLFGCGEADVWRTKFTAKSPNGTIVDGVVCEGIFKGATVRFN